MIENPSSGEEPKKPKEGIILHKDDFASSVTDMPAQLSKEIKALTFSMAAQAVTH